MALYAAYTLRLAEATEKLVELESQELGITRRLELNRQRKSIDKSVDMLSQAKAQLLRKLVQSDAVQRTRSQLDREAYEGEPQLEALLSEEKLRLLRRWGTAVGGDLEGAIDRAANSFSRVRRDIENARRLQRSIIAERLQSAAGRAYEHAEAAEEELRKLQYTLEYERHR